MNVAAVSYNPRHRPEVLMRTPTVVLDTPEEARARRERDERVQQHLSEGEREGARFKTISQMLSWFWAMKDHMASAPAIDPAREVIQGLQVDRDERIFWVGVTWKLLAQLRRDHGDRPFLLLCLHYRSPVEEGTRIHEGRKVANFVRPSIPIRELHEHDGENISRDATIADFYRARALIEEMALARGWIQERLQRKQNRVQVYRREPEQEAT